MKARHMWISVMITLAFLASGIVYAIKGDLIFSLVSFAIALLFGIRLVRRSPK